MNFDYYAATVKAEPLHLAQVLEGRVEQGLSDRVQSLEGGWRQYREGYYVRHLDAYVYHGGCNPHPHVRVAGEGAGLAAQRLRQHFPEHTVSRVDSCRDFSGEGAWQSITDMLLHLAKKNRLGTRLVGSPTDERKGRTLYIGSRKSSMFVRAYEKGKQLAEEGWTAKANPDGTKTFQRGWQGRRDSEETPSPDWIRVEVEYKPQKGPEKAAAAHLSAEAVWTTRRWTSTLYGRLTGLVATYDPPGRKGGGDPGEAIRHMTRQYTVAVRQSMDAVGVELVRKHFAEWLEFCERTRS